MEVEISDIEEEPSKEQGVSDNLVKERIEVIEINHSSFCSCSVNLVISLLLMNEEELKCLFQVNIVLIQ